MKVVVVMMTRAPLLLSRHKEYREENIRGLQKMK